MAAALLLRASRRPLPAAALNLLSPSNLHARIPHPQSSPHFSSISSPSSSSSSPSSPTGSSELYRELLADNNGGAAKRPQSDREHLEAIFRHFAKSGWASDQALAIYIPASFFPTAVHRFRHFLFSHISPSLFSRLLSLPPSPSSDRLLFPLFADFSLHQFPAEIKSFKLLVQSADLTAPHSWFPFARAMKRKIVYHCGPTNSGKTFNALRRFMAAAKAVYCSPLRLLAMEVFDKVNSMGVYCSLLTGQEHKIVPFAKHTACTVEMVSTDELYEVAVIDEIQMMADQTRGCAWTRALLGLKADEIHLCGDPSVLAIVRKICADTGDELEEINYNRFKPLVVESKTLEGDLKKVESGDCIVAFSRREIFEVKLAVEKLTSHRCCVIYGALPPETRRQQAALFNDGGGEYDVLVASDAVGMGLNLNIRRVIFYSLSKYDGDRVVPVPASQVKQIAGRAGRRGSRYPDGLVTTFNAGDLDYLLECLRRPFEEAKQVGLFPFFEQFELFASQIPDLPFAELLDRFRLSCRLDGAYFLSRHDHVRKVANLLERVPGLSLADRFNFCFAPANTRDPKVMHHLVRFAASFSERKPVGITLGMPRASARSDAELLDMEAKHQVVSVYLWLAHHFKEDTFPQAEKAQEMASGIADLLGKSLARVSWKPEPPRRKREKDGAEEYLPEDDFEEDCHQRPRSLVRLFQR